MKDFLATNILFYEILASQQVRVEQNWEKKFEIMFDFLEIFGNPHLKIKNIIHITGTNGKGSVCAFLKEILLKSDYSINIFTSPHLVEINERFFVQNSYISQEILEEISNEIYVELKERNLEQQITYFEACTLIALIAFAKKQADFNIFEVGLGGRLDATNIFPNKICSIITSISKDHENILGNTRELIAKEKIAIARTNTNLDKAIIFSGEDDQKIVNVFKQELQNLQMRKIIQDYKINILNKDFFIKNTKISLSRSRLQNIFDFDSKNIKKRINNIKTNLFGNYQFNNAGLALEVAKFLQKDLNFNKITNNSIKKGLLNAKWPARFQFLNLNFIKKSKIILDGCHNEDGVKKMCQTLIKVKKQLKVNNIIGICAFLETKNINTIVQYLTVFNNIICTDISDKTSDMYKKFLSKEIINLTFIENNIKSTICDFSDIKKFEQILKTFDSKENLIVFFGSLYFAGEVLKLNNLS